MTQVRNTFGRLVQRIVGKARVEAPVQAVQPLKELDTRVVAQVVGGTSATETPRNGW